MISETLYVGLLADLLNRDPNPRTRERRVRDANRALYGEVVGHATNRSTTKADLALCLAAQREHN